MCLRFILPHYKILLKDAQNNHDITQLRLNQKNIGDQAVKYLANGLKKTVVKTLDLSENKIGEKGAEYLASGLKYTLVTTLNLSVTKIGDQGAKHLASGLEYTSVTTLKLTETKIGEQGAKYLASGLKDSQVRTLYLRRNELGEQGAKYLANGLKYSKVRTLDVGWNGLFSEGVKYLVDGLKDTQVTTLDLRGNYIGETGAKYIANGLSHTHVTTLNLDYNFIETQGAICIADNLRHSRLSVLDLSENGISDEGAISLASGLKNTRVTVLNLFLNSIHSRITRCIEKLLEKNKELIKIGDDFKLLVCKEPGSDLLIFQVHSPAGGEKWIDIEKHLSLMKNVHDNPGVVSVLINDPDRVYAQQEVVEFIQNISIQFCEFICKYLEVSHREYVSLIKYCEDSRLDFVVKDLLLNRGACLIEESNGDILYPYVYILLNQYNQPLLANDQAFKSNKQQIIKYFQDHPDLEYAQDAIQLLEAI